MRRILVVDDQLDYLESLTAALSRDFDVITARSLPEAESVFSEDISAALLDVRLSEDDPANVDGLRLLEWLRRTGSSIPIVVMSAYREFELAVTAQNLGASYFLKKPIGLSELTRILRIFTDPSASEESIAKLRSQSLEELKRIS